MGEFDPEVFGKYYLVDRIAVGGMAEIFKAKTFSHGGFEKLLVIKRILSHLSDNEDFVSMFIDEAKISVSLQHANIVQIYDFGKLRDNYFIAMEWVDGKDVKQILRKLASRRKLLPEEFSVYIAHEACKALDFAHQKADLGGNPLDIIHRDVSPSNVLVSYDGEIKIADFGIAKAQMSAYNTKDGVLKGKFEYMSPEQARAEGVSQKSDIFSAGIILYEMLTGRRLFKTDSDIKTLEKVKTLDIRPLTSINPNISPRLEAIVMRALTKEPEKRYRDAGEFQSALMEYMYPSTPSVIQKSFALFMREVFNAERVEEVARLERGSTVARGLHSQTPDLILDDSWAEELTSRPGTTNNSRIHTLGNSVADVTAGKSPWRLAILLLAFLAAVAIFVTRSPTDEPPRTPDVPTTETVVATTATVQIDTKPPTTEVLREGALLGTGPQLVVELEAGEHDLTYQAVGYEPQDEHLTLVAGERVRLRVKLESLEEAPEKPATPPEAPAVAPERPAKVQAPAPEPEEDAEEEEEPPPPPPPPPPPGKVNINVVGTWAHVYIDGTMVGDTPLNGYSISPGTHVVRVVNETLEFDATQTVQVQSGITKKVFFDAN